MNKITSKLCTAAIMLFFTSMATHAEEIILDDLATGQMTTSTIDNTGIKTKVSKKQVSPSVGTAAFTCMGTITIYIGPAQVVGGFSNTYNFSQSTACNNQYASITISNLSNASLAVGLQQYTAGVWKTIVSPIGYSILMKLPTGSYRWIVQNSSRGVTGTYTGNYQYRY